MAPLMETVVTVRPDMSDFQREAVSGVQTALSRVGQISQRAGSTLSRAVTAPVAALGVAGVRMAVDFDDAFRRIEGLVGVTGQELEALRDAALELGPAYGKSANEAAEAMFFITSAGLRGQDAIDVLDASLRASAVGLGDTATVADLATSAMNAYGSEVLSATNATDVLTAAVREGKLEPDQLAGAMGRVLPIASAMGVSFDQVGAAFAAMSRTGTNANEAATQLRGIMTSILNPAAQSEEALERMGLSAEGLRQQIREQGLLSVLETLAVRFHGNDAAAAEVFGNVRALAGVMDLMGANAGTTRDIFESMEDSSGSLANAFEVTSEGPGFEFNRTMAELKTTMMELGVVILPIVQDVATAVRGLLERLAEMTPEQREMLVQVLGIAAAVGPALLILGRMASAISAITGAMRLMNLAFLANPWVLAIAGVVAVIAVVWRFRDEIAEFIAGIVDWFAGLGDRLAEPFQRFRDIVAGVFEGALDIAKGFINTMLGLWETVINGPATAANMLIRAANLVPGVNIPELPRIELPRLAEGGDIVGAGRVLVGEEGPELLDLPRGARVTPLDKAGGTTNVTMNVTVQGGSFNEEKLAAALDRLARKAAATTSYRRPE